jgi:hypothetical protein
MIIFLSVAAYNDPELFNTIVDAYSKADNPSSLIFGILDQCFEDRYECLPAWKNQIRYAWMKDRDARGVGFARALIQGMMEGEDYLLQIDSHMRFDQHWDTSLVAQLNELPWKSILTTYPMPWDPETGVKPLPAGKTIKLYPHQKYPLRSTAKIVKTGEGNGHRRGSRLAAGFLFTRGCLYDHVPYDPHIYFNGEEHFYALRVQAAGWSIYHPRLVPIYHLYKKSGDDPSILHWGRTTDRYWDPRSLRAKGEKRVAKVIEGAAGLFSILSQLGGGALDRMHSDCLSLNNSEITDQSRLELEDIRDILAPVILGKHSSVAGGGYTSFAHQVDYRGVIYFVKSSTDEAAYEGIVDSYLLNQAICAQGSSFQGCAPLLTLAKNARYYQVYPYVKHVSLRRADYQTLSSNLTLPYAAGEMNALNRDRSNIRRIEAHQFKLALNEKRLQRRFPAKSLDELVPYLSRANQALDRLTERSQAIPPGYYSLSHNDLHRSNLGLLKKKGMTEPIVIFDWGKARWAPFGNDLKFFAFYLLESGAGQENWNAILSSYAKGLEAGGVSVDIDTRLLLLGWMLGYAEAWLNIHRWPALDWRVFVMCLEIIEEYACTPQVASSEECIIQIVKVRDRFESQQPD